MVGICVMINFGSACRW